MPTVDVHRHAFRRHGGVLTIALLLAFLWALPVTAGPLGLAKAAHVTAERDGSFTVTYDLLVANLGSEALASLRVEDDLASAFASATSFSVLSVDSDRGAITPSFDGRTAMDLLAGTDVLDAGESLRISIAVRVVTNPIGGSFENVAVARGTLPAGVDVVDRSQDGGEPDPDWDGDPTNNDAPTLVHLVPRAQVGAAQRVVSIAALGDGRFSVTYEIIVENYGQLVLSDVRVQQDFRAAFPPPADARVTSVRSADFAVNPAFDGRSDIHLLAGGHSMVPGERGAVTLVLDLAPNGGRSWFESRAFVTSVAPDGVLAVDLSTSGRDPDPDGNGDPTDDHRPTELSLADTRLSGYVEVTTRLTDGPTPIEMQSVVLSGTARVDPWTANANARWTGTSFDLLSFSWSGPFGDARLSSVLTFRPSALEFVSWQTTSTLSLFGVGFSNTLFVTTPRASSYDLLRISGSAGPFDLEATIRLGVCPPSFWQATFCADWQWALCETPLTACLSLTGVGGFESLSLGATGIPVFSNLFNIAGFLDVAINYGNEEKTLSPRLRFEPDWAICPEIVFLGEVVLTSPAVGVRAVRITGAKIEVPIGDVVFRAAESFADDKNAAITGKAAYFEVFGVRGPFPSCCGSAGRVEGAVYFERDPAPSGALFAVGLIEGLVDFQIGRHLALSCTTQFTPTSPHWGITLRVRVLW